MVAGLAAGATWFISVSETRGRRPADRSRSRAALAATRRGAGSSVLLAAAVFAILVATLRDGARDGLRPRCLGGVARDAQPHPAGRGTPARSSRLCRSPPSSSALTGTRSGDNPTHSRDFVYYVVSLDPWPFYLALAGIVVVVAALGPWLDGPRASHRSRTRCRRRSVVALVGLEPNTVHRLPSAWTAGSSRPSCCRCSSSGAGSARATTRSSARRRAATATRESRRAARRRPARVRRGRCSRQTFGRSATGRAAWTPSGPASTRHRVSRMRSRWFRRAGGTCSGAGRAARCR